MPSIPGGLETWLPGGGVVGMLTFLAVGLSKGWIWTKPQVDRLIASHDATLTRVDSRNERETTRVVALLEARAEESREREKEWREVANTALETNREVAGQMDAVIESQRTIIDVVSAARQIQRDRAA